MQCILICQIFFVLYSILRTRLIDVSDFANNKNSFVFVEYTISQIFQHKKPFGGDLAYRTRPRVMDNATEGREKKKKRNKLSSLQNDFPQFSDKKKKFPPSPVVQRKNKQEHKSK